MSFLVARIGKPHSLRGEVTVQSHTDDPAGRFVPGAVFVTEARAGSGVPKVLTLRSARRHKEVWLLAFEEIPDRTGAESLRGTRLLIDEDAVAHQDEEGWYEDELLGMVAVDPSGAVIGEVVGLDLGAAQDRLLVRLSDGTRAEIPFVEAIVPTVDQDAGRVVIDAPPGLLDLSRGQ